MPKEMSASAADTCRGADGDSGDDGIILSLLYGFSVTGAIANPLYTLESTTAISEQPLQSFTTALFEERWLDARGTRCKGRKGNKSHDGLYQHIPEKYEHKIVRPEIDSGGCHQGIGRAQGRSRGAPVPVPVLRRQRSVGQGGVLELSLRTNERREGVPLHALSDRRQFVCGRIPEYNGGRSNGINKGANVMQRMYWLLSFFFLCCLIMIFYIVIPLKEIKNSFSLGGGDINDDISR